MTYLLTSEKGSLGQIKSWGAGGGVQSVKYARDGRLISCGRDRMAKVWDQSVKWG